MSPFEAWDSELNGLIQDILQGAETEEAGLREVTPFVKLVKLVGMKEEIDITFGRPTTRRWRDIIQDIELQIEQFMVDQRASAKATKVAS